MANVVNAVTELANPIAQQLGLELVEVEYVKEGGSWFLRVYIDRDGGVGHEHCEAMSRALDAELDRHDLIPHSYYLEVSSPGAERALRRDEDFVRFVGRHVSVKTYAPFNGRKEWRGELVGLQEDKIVVRTDATQVAIPREQVSLARLALK